MSANRILKASTNGTYGNVQGWEAVGYEDTHNSIDGFPCFSTYREGFLNWKWEQNLPIYGTARFPLCQSKAAPPEIFPPIRQGGCNPPLSESD